MMHADVVVARSEFEVAARLDVRDDEVVAVVGPNGAGKTTLLHAIADSVAGAGIVFQDRRLFPHLTVLDNVAFGADRAHARPWLERLGITELADAKPAALSGGQAQRVAVARTLAAEPDVLLLDEPFVALDPDSHAIVRRVITDFAGPRVVVTHDPLTAAGLADRVVVLERGAVVQEGTLAELAAHPRSAYVADLVGVNWLPAAVGDDGMVVVDGDGAFVSTTAPAPGRAVVTVHPRAIAVHDREPGGSPRNVFEGRVIDVDRAGDRVRVTIDGPPRLVAEVTSAAAIELQLQVGRPVWFAVKATEVVVHPA